MRSQPTDADGVEATTVTVDLGEIASANSRHAGRRSTVALVDGVAVVGTADGTVHGVDADGGERLWTSAAGTGALVSATAFGDAVVVGERGHDGEIRAHDVETGDVQWRYRSVDDVGEARKDTRFFLPFVADLRADGERVYAAARRYERGNDGSRDFESVVYAFDAGEVVWTYETDGSPIALDCDGAARSAVDDGENGRDGESVRDGDAAVTSDRVAVGYNRCPGDQQQGLVVLDAADGTVEWTWDPGNDGQRRVGDVSFSDDGVAVTSHGDYRGYRLAAGGEVVWSADLATPASVGDETLYAYPNHVHATDEGVVFVTGNTYPEEGRQTESNHPDDHTVFGYDADGRRQWSFEAGGFVTGIGTGGDCVAVPVAQNFRERDASVHGYHVVDVAEGRIADVPVDGIASASALDGDRVAAVEEPVEYHDEGVRHGAYRLHLSDARPLN